MTATLGTSDDAQIIEEYEGESEHTFLLHYNFPPFSVGETKFMRGPSRRDIGHGNLARRSLSPMLPSEDAFPYTVRIVSDILESNGSSSMPGMNGFELAARLRATGSTAALVFLTVHEEEEFLDAARAVGAIGYVVKPRLNADLQVAVQEARAGREFPATHH